MQYYFKTSDDNEYGPVDEGKIRAWLEQGRMNQDSLVRAIDSGEWRLLNDYPELMALLAPSSSAPPSSPSSPSSPQADVKHYAPHRGAMVLTFGILSIACCFPFGIAAWIIGNDDLKQIDAGMMDPAGRGITNAGKICGMVGVILTAVGCGFQLIMLIVGAASEM